MSAWNESLTTSENLDALEARFVAAALQEDSPFVVAANADALWLILAGILVFFMHAGFTMLEAGSVQHRNAVNILFKNVGTISIGSIMYFFFGYGFAYGVDNEGDDSFAFIGAGSFFRSVTADGTPALFFFQAMFAATAATIVSGAVAGRVALPGYFLIAIWLTGFVYPVVSHWIWAAGGWASAFTDQADTIFGEDGGCGMLDYAGSGVVHMTGGVAAFVVSAVLGPRIGRFSGGDDAEFAPHNLPLCALGTFILWFGWYGFNCGSTLAFDGVNAGNVAVTTTLAPSAAVVTGIVLNRAFAKTFDLANALNCALAGLVSITAGCSTVTDAAAIPIGVIGALVYMGSSKLMKKMKIDDPVDAISVHGSAGLWGVVAVGLFAQEELIFGAYSSRVCDGAGGLQLQTQIVGALAIVGWVVATVLPLAIVLKVTKKLRVTEEQELTGLDASEHGGAVAFIPGDIKVA